MSGIYGGGSGGSGAGDVVGPASSTDDAVARFSGATGKLLQNSVVIIGDTGNITGVGSLTMSGTLTVSGGFIQKYTSTATSYPVLVTDQIIGVTSTAAARTITMPNAGLVTGQMWVIKDESAACSVNNIIIDGNGANIIGTTSASTYVLNANGASVNIYYNGATFCIV